MILYFELDSFKPAAQINNRDINLIDPLALLHPLFCTDK